MARPLGEGGSHLCSHRRRQRVERARPVERDDTGRSYHLRGDLALAHAGSFRLQLTTSIAHRLFLHLISPTRILAVAIFLRYI